MIKKLSLLVSCFVLSSTAWSAQSALRVAEIWSREGLPCASRCFPVAERFFSTSQLRKPQIYTIPTYDAAFKWVLSDDRIRSSFFHAFIPGVNIQSSERLDDHMNPIEKLQTLREFLHKEETSAVVKDLSGSSAYIVKSTSKPTEKNEEATAFLHEMVGRFDEIKASFPKSRYDGTMDFVCQLDNGSYALVEMQVIPQNYWDRRALAYVAAFYGNQLSRGGTWKNIKKVIGVNILGGGKDDKVHWTDTPDHFMRHYKFEEQLNGKGRFIDGIELIQYSLMNKAPMLTDREKQDWLIFFREARYMNEEDVESRIKTPAVLQAFERAKISKLPTAVQADYEAEDEEYDRYSQHTAEQVTEAKAKALEEVARKMLKVRKTTEEIIEITGLSKEQIERLHH